MSVWSDRWLHFICIPAGAIVRFRPAGPPRLVPGCPTPTGRKRATVVRRFRGKTPTPGQRGSPSFSEHLGSPVL